VLIVTEQAMVVSHKSQFGHPPPLTIKCEKARFPGLFLFLYQFYALNSTKTSRQNAKTMVAETLTTCGSIFQLRSVEPQVSHFERVPFRTTDAGLQASFAATERCGRAKSISLKVVVS